jgi:hypothetical protein
MLKDGLNNFYLVGTVLASLNTSSITPGNLAIYVTKVPATLPLTASWPSFVVMLDPGFLPADGGTIYPQNVQIDPTGNTIAILGRTISAGVAATKTAGSYGSGGTVFLATITGLNTPTPTAAVIAKFGAGGGTETDPLGLILADANTAYVYGAVMAGAISGTDLQNANSINPSGSGRDVFLAKVSGLTPGTVTLPWLTQLGNGSGTLMDAGLSSNSTKNQFLAQDTNTGLIYISGYTGVPVPRGMVPDYTFLAAIDPNQLTNGAGTVKWFKGLGPAGVAIPQATPTQIFLDPLSPFAYILGYTNGDMTAKQGMMYGGGQGTQDVFLTKFSAAGVQQ